MRCLGERRDRRRPRGPVLSTRFAVTFLDASALAKRYIREAESARVTSRLGDGLCAISRITEVEVASAIARRHREGAFDGPARDAILDQLAQDVPRLVIVELTPAVVLRARQLVKRHPLRAADAIQLASALLLVDEMPVPVAFMAYDQRLVEAARGEDLSVV